MGRGYRAIVFLGLCAALVACAAISGLDGIQVNACVPDGCDASPQTGNGSPVTLADGSSGGEGTDASDEPATSDEAESGDAAVDTGPREATGPDASQADVATAQASDASDAEMGEDTGTPPDAATDAATTVDAADAGGTCGTLYFADSFASNANGWTLDTGWTIAAECAAPPAPQKGNPDPTSDHTGTSGSGVVGAFVCGNNPSGQTTPYRYATSRSIDVSNAPILKLDFWRWLNTDAADWMASTIDVYDGSAWVNVYTNPSGTANYVLDAAWTHEEIDVTAQKNPAFQVRFGYSIVSAAVYEMSSWNIDDVTLSSGSCD